MADSDATRAVIEAARTVAKRACSRARLEAELDRTSDWSGYLSSSEKSLVLAIAQYDREAKDE